MFVYTLNRTRLIFKRTVRISLFIVTITCIRRAHDCIHVRTGVVGNLMLSAPIRIPAGCENYDIIRVFVSRATVGRESLLRARYGSFSNTVCHQFYSVFDKRPARNAMTSNAAGLGACGVVGLWARGLVRPFCARQTVGTRNVRKSYARPFRQTVREPRFPGGKNTKIRAPFIFYAVSIVVANAGRQPETDRTARVRVPPVTARKTRVGSSTSREGGAVSK